jgi:hypothetical protein
MNYDIAIYEPTVTNPDFRFSLGTYGEKPLFVIGLNPSTADDKKPDRTITKVMGFATNYDCDSFIMLNLYAQRTPNPDVLHKEIDEQLHTQNLSYILTALEKYNAISILASWGVRITIRNYLRECLLDIYNETKNKNINWLKIGELTRDGHPRHPSRGAYLELTGFNIENYLTIYSKTSL